MKKEIRKVTKDIIQITTVDERWYVKEDEFVPSVTWICDFYPKGIAFYKWLANKGWDESESIKKEAGEKGSKVHYAIEDLVARKTVKIDSKYFSESSGQEEELTPVEYECVMSFANWYEEVRPKILKSEVTGFKDNHFAGTIDLVCEIDGQLWIVDYKTSQYVWPSHELQLSAYKNLPIDGVDISNAKMAILQVGYARNKKKWKFTEIKDKFKLFKAAYQIWQNETAGQSPMQKDYPKINKESLGL
jgi:hypothetical protein